MSYRKLTLPSDLHSPDLERFWQVAVKGRPLLVFTDGEHTFTIRRGSGEALEEHLSRLNAVVQLAEDGMFSLYTPEDEWCDLSHVRDE